MNQTSKSKGIRKKRVFYGQVLGTLEEISKLMDLLAINIDTYMCSISHSPGYSNTVELYAEFPSESAFKTFNSVFFVSTIETFTAA